MNFSNNIDFLITLITAIFFLCLLPIIGILIYTKKGKIDIWVSDRKTRTPFYALAILGYISASAFFYLTNLNDLLTLSLAYVFVTSTVALINLKGAFLNKSCLPTLPQPPSILAITLSNSCLKCSSVIYSLK